MSSIFDDADATKIPERYLHWLNAFDVAAHRALDKYELIYQAFEKPEQMTNREVACMTWELVDWLDRTRKILGSLAGLKRKDPLRILAERSLQEMVEVRNILQHFNEHIIEAITADFAPLGSISAIVITKKGDDGSVIELAMPFVAPGIVMGNKDIGSVSMPGRARDDVDHVTLHLGEESANLSNVMYKLMDFYKQTRVELAEKYPKEKATD